MPQISVIMPVYNSEKYLKKAVESVLDQTFKDFEVILVDDGSQDNSGKICDLLQKEDSRVVVIHQENGGICNARNHAIAIARGEYIAFCDNDDIMLPECLEKAISVAREHPVDIVRFFRAHYVIENGRSICIDFKGFSSRTKTISIENWNSYINVLRTFAYGPWAGIYRKKFLDENEIRFDEEARYGFEDVYFVSQCCAAAQSVGMLYDTLYLWIQRKGFSTTMKSNREVFENRLLMLRKWRDFENQTGIRLGRKPQEKSERYMDYISMIADECNLAATGNKKRKLFIKTKKLFSRDEKMIFIPKSIKAWIRYVCIHTNSIGLLKHIQKIRQYYIGARNKIVIKDTMYKYKFS